MKTLTPFVFVFAALIVFAMYLGNSDPITGAVAEARAGTATGSVKLDIINEAFQLIFHLTTGGIIVTALGWAVMNADKFGKIWRHWWSQKLTRRGTWKPGPNAQWQQQPKAQRLTDREMLMLMMTNGGRMPARTQRLPRMQDQTQDNELNIEL